MKGLEAPEKVPAEFRHFLVSAFPEFANSRLTVAGRGWHSLAVEIDGRIIAKFPSGAEAEEALRREARLLEAVRPRVRMPVPAMVLHEGPPLFSLHEKLPGRRLERSDYLQLEGPARDRLVRDLAGFFADLHAIPVETMRAAGAERAEWWDTQPQTLEPVWAALPADVRGQAFAAVEDYRSLRFAPEHDVYGHFDAHGWNMAFDRARSRLGGIFDFADSGFGPPEREFVQLSLTHPELARLAIDAYEEIARREIDRRRVFLLAAAQRLSEFAGALETGEGLELVRHFAIEWFEQRSVR